MTRALAALLMTLTVTASGAAPPQPELIDVRTPTMQVTFSARDALPVAWRVCVPGCDTPGRVRDVNFLTNGDAPTLLAPARGTAPGYSVSEQQTDDAQVIVFTPLPGSNGPRFTRRYEIPRAGYVASLLVDAHATPAPGLQLRTGNAFSPTPLPGFGSIYTQVKAIVTTDGHQRVLDPDEGDATASLAQDEWSGLRSRYWAFLVSPATTTHTIVASSGDTRQPVIDLAPAADSNGHQLYRIYAGPLMHEPPGLSEVGLSGLLFAALWDWLRALCFGLLFLLQWLERLIGNTGLAIIALSLTVKVMMLPLTALADRWQTGVHEIQSRLQPRLDDIKARYRGEEQHNRILAVYREEGISPMYTLRSLFGVLIQIPVFIAAFDMLGENFSLGGVSFLWIEDLAAPDRFAALPFELPFFGAHLNLLPIIMAAVSALSAFLSRDPALSPALQRRQRLRLFGLAGAFLALFYTFPAGMVLYWTSSNVFHLLKQQFLTRH